MIRMVDIVGTASYTAGGFIVTIPEFNSIHKAVGHPDDPSYKVVIKPAIILPGEPGAPEQELPPLPHNQIIVRVYQLNNGAYTEVAEGTDLSELKITLVAEGI